MTSTLQDLAVPDWAAMQLPDSWADQLKLWRAWDLLKLLLRALAETGFVCITDEEHFPSRIVVARRQAGAT